MAISIRPGYDADTVLGYLKDAERGAANFLGQGSPALADYLVWASTHIRTLGPSISAADLDDLLTTRRHWALLGLMELAVSSTPGLAQLVNVEMVQRRAGLEIAAQELELAILWSKNRPAAVLDTNVVLTLGERIRLYGWHGLLNERPHELVQVWIPMAVVDELDRLKRDRTPMHLNGEKIQRRTLARLALRNLDEMFPDPRWPYEVEHTTEPIHQRVSFHLLAEEPGHVRLPSVDAEVVDRAVGLTAFGGRVKLITYDTGMRLRARAAELEARQLPDPEDD